MFLCACGAVRSHRVLAESRVARLTEFRKGFCTWPTGLKDTKGLFLGENCLNNQEISKP